MSPPDLDDHLHDPARLAALHAVALLDSPAEEAFDRLSRLAARLLDAPVALVSLVDTDRQFFKSCIGLEAEPWSSDRQTPLSHSFCQHNRVAGQPLAVNDARVHPLFKENLAIRDLDVVAYLGFPLSTSDGYVLGSFCVIDTVPRDWDENDIAIIRDLAASVMVEIQLRTEVATRHQVEGELDTVNELNEQLRSEMAARKLAEDQKHSLETQLLQASKLEAVGQLAGGVAHDLNNLLAPILIYTSLLLGDKALADDHHDIVEQMQNAGLRARDLIRQLLAFSRMQAMEFQVNSIEDMVSNLETLLRRTIPEDITMTVETSPEPLLVLADTTQVEQIIMNLVVNAADAMLSGGELRIETYPSVLDKADLVSSQDAEPGPYSTLEIGDSGVGMSNETLEHLFEPFFSTKDTLGTGLGLSTVMGIVMQHGGVIECESELGAGTTFRVHFPITEDDVTSNDESVDPEQHADCTHVETILLAEDDDQVREVARLVLSGHGFMVITATDGADALKKLSNNPDLISLLVTDVVMPGMNGRALYESAIEMQPELKVLYMSGYSEDIISHRGVIDAGINFLAKPFLPDELLTKVDDLLAPVPSQS